MQTVRLVYDPDDLWCECFYVSVNEEWYVYYILPGEPHKGFNHWFGPLRINTDKPILESTRLHFLAKTGKGLEESVREDLGIELDGSG